MKMASSPLGAGRVSLTERNLMMIDTLISRLATRDDKIFPAYYRNIFEKPTSRFWASIVVFAPQCLKCKSTSGGARDADFFARADFIDATPCRVWPPTWSIPLDTADAHAMPDAVAACAKFQQYAYWLRRFRCRKGGRYRRLKTSMRMPADILSMPLVNISRTVYWLLLESQKTPYNFPWCRPATQYRVTRHSSKGTRPSRKLITGFPCTAPENKYRVFLDTHFDAHAHRF